MQAVTSTIAQILFAIFGINSKVNSAWILPCSSSSFISCSHRLIPFETDADLEMALGTAERAVDIKSTEGAPPASCMADSLVLTHLMLTIALGPKFWRGRPDSERTQYEWNLFLSFCELSSI